MSAQHYTRVLTLMSLVFEQAILHTLYNDSVGKAQFSTECMDSRSCVEILGHCRIVLRGKPTVSCGRISAFASPLESSDHPR